jgi:hypothetical protein
MDGLVIMVIVIVFQQIAQHLRHKDKGAKISKKMIDLVINKKNNNKNSNI